MRRGLVQIALAAIACAGLILALVGCGSQGTTTVIKTVTSGGTAAARKAPGSSRTTRAGTLTVRSGSGATGTTDTRAGGEQTTAGGGQSATGQTSTGQSGVTGAGTGEAATVPVVRCPLTADSRKEKATGPSRVRVGGHPSSTAGLSEYETADAHVVAPTGFHCLGEIGEDDSFDLEVWQSGSAPTAHSPGAALTVQVDGACAGCQAFDACPFFRAFARKLGFPCHGGIPAGETVSDHGPSVVFFRDPAGVAGDGDPSGGPDPANGFVLVPNSGGPNPYEVNATCTLPANQVNDCTTSLDAELADFGVS